MQDALPLGYRFKPNEEELVKYFLLGRVRGEPLPWNRYPIIECDLYGKATPREIFGETSDQKIGYCFTRLKKTSKKRVSRVAANGTWHGEKSAVEIRDINNNKIIGAKKTFAFKMKGVWDKRTSWIMHEFSLAGEYDLTVHQESCNIVLCKIKKKTKESLVAETSLQREQGMGLQIITTTNLGKQVPFGEVAGSSSSMFRSKDQLGFQYSLSSLKDANDLGQEVSFGEVPGSSSSMFPTKDQKGFEYSLTSVEDAINLGEEVPFGEVAGSSSSMFPSTDQLGFQYSLSSLEDANDLGEKVSFEEIAGSSSSMFPTKDQQGVQYSLSSVEDASKFWEEVPFGEVAGSSSSMFRSEDQLGFQHSLSSIEEFLLNMDFRPTEEEIEEEKHSLEEFWKNLEIDLYSEQ